MIVRLHLALIVGSISLFPSPLPAQWKALGPFGGPASTVVTDPLSPRTVIAGTQNGLLFRSQDMGVSWTPLPFPAQLRAVLHTLVVDPSTSGVYLAGLSSEIPEYSGILRSTDGGATWRQVAALRGRQVRAIAFWRGNPQVLVAGTEVGVFQSLDGGIEWRQISPPDNPQLQPIVSLAIDPADRNVIYAGTPHLPWKTTDGGSTWFSIHNGILDDSDVFSIAIDRNRPTRIFVSTCSGIYRSMDAGDTWTRLHRAKDASDRTYVIVQDPQYENIWVAGTTHGMMRSVNGGVTWEMLGHLTTRAITFDLGLLGRIYIATDESGILRSDDGGRSWVDVNHGFCSRIVDSLFTRADGAVYTTTFSNSEGRAVYRLSIRSGEWERLKAAQTQPGPAGTDPPDIVDEPRNSEAPVNAQGETIQAIFHHPSDPETLFAAKFGVIFSSKDGGHSWTKISPEPWPISSVKQLVILPQMPSQLFILTRQQGVFALTLEIDLPPAPTITVQQVPLRDVYSIIGGRSSSTGAQPASRNRENNTRSYGR
jgi:photosystem II stability/assembly factor-like uncharacterized protein